jgi:rod shape-determining protein MreD
MSVFFYFATLLGGFFLELLVGRYLSLFGVGPDLLLLMVIAMGFALGPVIGELFGFGWGLLADTVGVTLFGSHCFILTLLGYAAGKLRRRMDTERPGPQVVIACLSTLLSASLLSFIRSFLEEGSDKIGLGYLLIAVMLNGLLASGVFWIAERWIELWKIDREHL